MKFIVFRKGSAAAVKIKIVGQKESSLHFALQNNVALQTVKKETQNAE